MAYDFFCVPSLVKCSPLLYSLNALQPFRFSGEPSGCNAVVNRLEGLECNHDGPLTYPFIAYNAHLTAAAVFKDAMSAQ